MKRTSVLLLAALSVTPAFSFNVLVNPGFETGALGPWYTARDFGGIVPWAVTAFFPHTGGFCATDTGNYEMRQDITPTAGSLITEISFWARHPDPSSEPLAFDLFYSDTTDFEGVVFTATDTWEFFDVTSSLDTSKTLVAFSVWGYVGGGSQVTYIDDAKINAVVPEPATIAVLGAGALALLRRRRA